MRVLRRLERNHDGFRSEKGRQNAIKIYQAVTYLGWSIHNLPNLGASKSNQVRLVQSLRSDTNEIRGFANAVYQSLLF
jgi:hypothetical protein